MSAPDGELIGIGFRLDASWMVAVFVVFFLAEMGEELPPKRGSAEDVIAHAGARISDQAGVTGGEAEGRKINSK